VRSAVACSLFVACLIASATPAAAVPGRGAYGGLWQPPVSGPVERGFEPPARQYGPGHLGVDYAVAPGTIVRAAGAGVVAFAGTVGGAVHVVVAHSNGLRTSYSFLASALVHRGQTVGVGQPVGRSGGKGTNHDGGVVHFGLRVGNTYVDPLLLFRPPDLAKIVHLAPHRDPVLDSIANERRGLLSGFAHATMRVLGAAKRAITAAAFVAQFPLSVRKDLLHLVLLGDITALALALDATAPVDFAGDTTQMARSLVAWAKSLRTCDRHAPPADGTGGSGNRVMVVAGIDSHRSRRGASAPVPVERLGYRSTDVSYFSYTDDGGAYGPADTHEPLHRAAMQLRDQLRALQRAQPGRPVDLIAHSQGGVVALVFLLFFYDAHDPTLPPLHTVVTLSSPLRGDPLASLGVLLMHSREGRLLLASAGHNGQSIRDLAERSDVIDAIDRLRLPNQIALTTIGAAGDFVVPASSAHLPGSNRFDVDIPAVSPHSAVLRDPNALRAVRAAIEQRAMPCETFEAALTAAVAPVAITRIEHLGPLHAIANTN
jgi:Peptidase family M23